MPLRVAMVAACPFPARRGTPLRIQRLAEALIERGSEVEIITYHICGDDEDVGYPVHRIYNRKVIEPLPPGPTLAKLTRYDPALARLTRQLLRESKFDVIHAHHVEGLVAAGWARRGMKIPLIYDAHTMLGAELSSYWRYVGKKVVNRAGHWLDGNISHRADTVVTVTEDIRDRLIVDHHFDPATVQVAMNGVEVDHFAKAFNGRPPDRGRIIYTGTLAGYQGVEMLLDAFAKAHLERPAMRLTVAASSSFEPFEAQARNLGIRDAIDVETDDFELLPGKLGKASIAVVPRPDCPGIPQKLLNYMAAGKAIVACEGSAKVLENGVNGIVVPNDNSTAFAQALVQLYDDQSLVGQLGAAAYKFVVNNLSWSRTAEICERVYSNLLTPMG